MSVHDVWTLRLQGLSSRASLRISAIESRQDELDEKLSQVLFGTKANQEALDELKSMFVKYVGKLRENDDGSPSMSRSALENQQSQPSLLVESVEVQGVHISGDPSYAVDVEGSVEVRDVGKIATSPVPGNPTKVQTKPPSTSTGLGRESQLQELSAQTTTSATAKNAQPIPGGHEVKAGAPAVQKPNVSLGPLIPAPSVVPNIPHSVHPKPPSRSVAAAREPQPPSLSPPRTTCDAEKNAKKMPRAGELKADKMPGAREVKAGVGTAKAKNVGTTTDDSNPYDLNSAIDGLLEVGETVAQRSPKKQKKIAHTAADDEALPMPPEEAPSKVRTTTRDICHKVPSAEGKKLLVFNVHGTLLDHCWIAASSSTRIQTQHLDQQLELRSVELYFSLA
jgi:hypothetical protein